MGSPVAAELAGLCGFDWVLIDLEHGCDSEAALPNQLRALRGSPTEPIVRVGAPHPDWIARVLDWGARGIMVPHVNTPEEAEAVVRAAHHPPRGLRGYSRTVRARDYGLRPPGAEEAPPRLLAQVETAEAVRNAAAIAQVEGIDVLFVGPADLQMDLRVQGQSEDYSQCLDEVVAAARSAGKQAGILVRDLADFQPHLDRGFTWVAVDSDLAILRKAYLAILGR